ncbi:MAG: tryptophan synthase subunit alpha [Cyanobacteria bacterium P01_H01_bin.74]
MNIMDKSETLSARSADTGVNGNNRYQKMFQAHQENGKQVFMPFTVLGWPNKTQSLAIIETMIASGASALELGLAFSDPMADGPIIQQASKTVIDNGFKVDDALELLQAVREKTDTLPIGVLVYFNMVLARGIPEFFKAMKAAGVDGILIADLPAELLNEVALAAQEEEICLICIVSPLTSPERLAKICTYASGFLYVVSRLGITGVEDTPDAQLSQLIKTVRQNTALPMLVGFGISTPERAQEMKAFGADGVIVGSRIIQVMDSADSFDAGLKTLSGYLKEMASA